MTITRSGDADATSHQGLAASQGELRHLAQELDARGEPYAMVTVVRTEAPSSAYAGAQAIVRLDGSLAGWIGGGCARTVVVNAAIGSLRQGAPRLVRIANDSQAVATDIDSHRMPCASNGAIELFIHPSTMVPLLLILGATPVAAAARAFAKDIGFLVTDSPEGMAPQLALVATQGDGDGPALDAALASTARRVLLIASARKAQRVRESLRARGVSEERLGRLEAPAGPDIGAKTPAEIALAAIAGVVAWWRTARNEVTADARAAPESAPLPASSPSTAGPGVDPVCGMAVDPAHARFASDHEGAKFYFCCGGCKAEFERNPGKYAPIGTSSHDAV